MDMIYLVPRPARKASLENKRRQLRRDYLKEQRLDIAMNEQAIKALRAQIEYDTPLAKAERENEKLKALLRPEPEPVVEEPTIPGRRPTNNSHSTYLDSYELRLYLALKREKAKNRPFWKVDED